MIVVISVGQQLYIVESGDRDLILGQHDIFRRSLKLDHLNPPPQLGVDERLLQVLVLGDHRLPGPHHLVHGAILVIVERFVQTGNQKTLIQTAYNEIEEEYTGQQRPLGRVLAVPYRIAKVLEEGEEFFHDSRNFRWFPPRIPENRLHPPNTKIVRSVLDDGRTIVGKCRSSEQRAEIPHEPPQQRDHDVVRYQYEPQVCPKREEEHVHVGYEAVIGHHEAYLVLVHRRGELKLLKTIVSLDEESRDAHVGCPTLDVLDQERERVPFDVSLPHRFNLEIRPHSLLEDEQRLRVYFIQPQPVPTIVRDFHQYRLEHRHVHGIMIQILKVFEQPRPSGSQDLVQTRFVHDAVSTLVPLERFVGEHASKIVADRDDHHPVSAIPPPQRFENIPPEGSLGRRSPREHDQVLIVRVPNMQFPMDQVVDRE